MEPQEEGGFIWRQVAPLFQWLGRQFETIAAFIVDNLIDFVLFGLTLITDAIDWFFDLLQNAMPESLADDFDALIPYFGVVQAYFPVQYALGLIAFSYAVQGVVVGFKFLLKFKQTVNPFG